MVAEESTSWPQVTKPPEVGGLGFNFKWNMGWMNDILSYVAIDPIYRKHVHEKITFSFFYCFNENYILPISHDEVVHGKYSLFNKMQGTYDQKFAAMRGFLAYMMAHPGKKLNFMGTEFAQIIEWNYKQGLDWLLLDYPVHAHFQSYVAALNHFYLATPALYDDDHGWDGTRMIVPDDCDQNIIAFERIARDGKRVLCVTNFSPVPRGDYRIGADEGTYTQVFCSADPTDPWNNASPLQAEPIAMHGLDHSIVISIPSYATVFFAYAPAKRRVRIGKDATPSAKKKKTAQKKPAAKKTAKTPTKKTASSTKKVKNANA